MLPSFISQRSEDFNSRQQVHEDFIQMGGLEVQKEAESSKKKPLADIMRKRQEKSTTILVLVVLVFFFSHIYRLLFRLFQMTYTERTVYITYHMCLEKGRYQVPVLLYIMADLHYLFLTINSSVNFLIYCCVSQEFRKQMMKTLFFRNYSNN